MALPDSTRLALLNALAALGQPDFPGLQDHEWAGSGDSVARQILEAWARHSETRQAGLLKGMAHPHLEVRIKALHLMLDGPLQEAYLPALVQALNDPSEHVRPLAGEVLLHYPPGEAALRALVGLLRVENGLHDRTARTIRGWAVQSGVGPVLELLDSPEVETRINGLKALRYANSIPEVLDRLLLMLHSQDAPCFHELAPTLALSQDRVRLRQELRAHTSPEAARTMALMADLDFKMDYYDLVLSRVDAIVEAGALGLELIGATDMREVIQAVLYPDPNDENPDDYDPNSVDD